jgi:hypothetical protein
MENIQLIQVYLREYLREYLFGLYHCMSTNNDVLIKDDHAWIAVVNLWF